MRRMSWCLCSLLILPTAAFSKTFQLYGDGQISQIGFEANAGGLDLHKSDGQAYAATYGFAVNVYREKSQYWYGTRKGQEIYYHFVRDPEQMSDYHIEGQRMGWRNYLYGGSLFPGLYLNALPPLGAFVFQFGTDFSYERLSVTKLTKSAEGENAALNYAPRRGDLTLGPTINLRYEMKALLVAPYLEVSGSYRYSLNAGSSAYNVEAAVGLGGFLVD